MSYARSPHPDVELQWGLRIPLHDGLHLSATLYSPAQQTEPRPVIFILTPYIAQTYHEYALYFATHGYPFLAIDVRGRGNSEGVFHPANDARDGYDVVEWIGKQPYCNGKVAMWGGSYSGYLQWAVAKQIPPRLSSLVPVAAPFRGLDSPMRNNIFLPYTMQWLTYLSGRCAQDRIFADQPFWSRQFKRFFDAGVAYAELDKFLGNPSALFQEWVAHPHLDGYWDAYNPTAEQYSKLSLPILTITGIYDGDQPGALAHYREHMKHVSPNARERHYLVIGPWDHAGTRAPKAEFCGLRVGPASLIDLRQLHLDWYRWTLEDGAKPEFLRKPVAYYVMGAERWRYAETLDAITVRSESLYLQSAANPTDVAQSGLLTAQLPCAQSEVDHYVYDPRDVSLAELESTLDPENRTDQRMLHAAAGKRLIYHSELFKDDTELSGFFRLTAWLSIDQPDTDFGVWIHEIALDGSSVLLTHDVMRARYRTSLREARLVRTSEPLRYEFERFMFVSRLVRRRHRLRLVIGPLDSIYFQKNYNSGDIVARESMQDARVVRVRLYHDAARPSALHVPIGQTES
jgi:uncharacterized protein